MFIAKITGTKTIQNLALGLLRIPGVGRVAQWVFRSGSFIWGILFESRYWISFWLRNKSGVVAEQHEPPLIVSMTSIAPRLKTVALCIESLMQQSLKPNKIILWLSDELDPQQLPSMLQKMKQFGLTIELRKDIGPHTKIHYALKEYPEAVIVTCDDDFIYPKKWLENIYAAYQREPDYIHCYRAHLITCTENGDLARYNEWGFAAPGFQGPSMLLFPTGVSGVLYPPGKLYKDTLNTEIFMELTPSNDDVWLKAMSAKQGTLCKKVFPYFDINHTIVSTQKTALWKTNVSARKNDDCINLTFGTYQIDALLLVCGESIPKTISSMDNPEKA